MTNDLIIDVGMNHGEDTEHYLSKGYRVVAIEANPALVAEVTLRLKPAIEAGNLTILNVGVAGATGHGTLWVNDDNDDHSSFVEAVGTRNKSSARAVRVPTIRFEEVLEQYGVPYYLKIDIECHDIFCLRAIKPNDKPKYISVEAHDLSYLCVLSELGYTKFKCLDQSRHNGPIRRLSNETIIGRASNSLISNWQRIQRRVIRPAAVKPPGRFVHGSSGPFGEDTPGSWQNLEDVAYDWLHFKKGYADRGTLNKYGWFDFHATH